MAIDEATKIDVFDAVAAFGVLDGREFSSLEELDDAMTRLWRRHVRVLPPNYGPRELFEFADRRGFVRRYGDRVRFVVDSEENPEPKE